MQREFYFDSKPDCDMWDRMWNVRTIEQELEACEIESPPRELFMEYLSKEGKILEAGCGFAKWVIYLHRRGYNILGIDNNEFAISKLKEYDSTLQLEVGDILNIKYPDNYFDAYISMGVVEHFEQGPHAALNEAYRLLKPGGLAFVSVPTVNIIRRIYRRSVRKAVNTFIKSLIIVKKGWSKSKANALYQAIDNLVPEKVKTIISKLPGRKTRYCHFTEYRYTREELENFLKQAGFEIIKTMPHDFYGSKNHAIGLWMDIPFLRDLKERANFRLNPVGEFVSRILDGISPWIACSSVICVAKSLKKDNTN
jgi:ubiquinone/menaquinone biosynthesis C-methylase UbiE